MDEKQGGKVALFPGPVRKIPGPVRTLSRFFGRGLGTKQGGKGSGRQEAMGSTCFIPVLSPLSSRTQIWKGDVYTTHKGRGKGADPVLGGPKQLHPEDSGGDLHATGGSKPASRRSSAVSFHQVRKLINPKKKEFSSKKQASLNYSRTKRVQAPTTALAPIDHKAYVGGFG